MSLVKNDFKKDRMGAVDRILAVATGKIPDRVPIYPMIDSIPSEIFGQSIKEYYSSAENVISGQSKLEELLNLDYISNFFYLAIESEVFGMDTIFFEGGSPNTGEPIAKSLDYFSTTDVPDLNGHPSYQKTLETTKGLAEQFKGKKPILSVQTGPFSFPSLLMGTSSWFESILMSPEKLPDIMDFAVKFGIDWAKGQLEAGADVIVMVDGLATATSIPRDMFEEYIIPLYQKITSQIEAPLVFYTAGGDMLPFADIFGETGAIGTFPSSNDDMREFKQKSEGKYTIFGNLNNLELGDWPMDFMETAVKETIEAGKPNGKFVLATQHMIPHNVSLEKIADLISMALKYAYY